MTDGETLIQSLATTGPLALVLAFGLRVLWAKLETKDARMEEMMRAHSQQNDERTREALTAIAANTAAITRLSDAIEGGGAARHRHGAD